MSATLHTTATPPAGPPERRPETSPPLARLVAVELRKAVDTRAGAWLLGVTVVLSLAVVVLRLCFGDRAEKTLVECVQLAQVPVNLLLPVIGILLVTSEWSQRTALTTFALIPHRGRVITAKATATVLLAVVATVVALLAAVAGFGVATALGATSGGFHLPAAMLWQVPAAQVLGVVMGLGFGLVLLASAPAIVGYFVLPTVWTVLSSIVAALRTPAEWLDTTRTFGPLLEKEALSGHQWAQLGTSAALWIALPLLLGSWRLHRKEIS